MFTPDQAVLTAMIVVEVGRGGYEAVRQIRHALHVTKRRLKTSRSGPIVWGHCVVVCLCGLVPGVFYASFYASHLPSLT